MGCYHPVRLREGAERVLTVPCGKCIGCKLERSRQWAVRIMHEASLYDRNCFITLTYDEEHLPERGSLDRAAFPLFMKRLRKSCEPQKVRYFHAGEYGSLLGRPHYHACLFNYDFGDKRYHTMRGGFPVWRSAALEALWPFGLAEVGTVTFESAAYVARYLVKREVDSARRLNLETGEVTEVEREYCTMSRRPGIAAEWLRLYGDEVFAADSVVVRGRECKPPRFYDSQFELIDPAGMAYVRAHRDLARRLRTRQELKAGECDAKSRVNLYAREEL